MIQTPEPISVLHLGAGRYDPDDRSHATFDIWRELAKGFEQYTVLGRSTDNRPGVIREGNLSVHLVPSRMVREVEFLFTQFRAVKLADQVGADVVVSQCPALGGLAAMRIARRRGAKVLLELHMAAYMEPAPRFSRWWLLQRLSRITLPRATAIRVLSKGMRARLLSFFGANLADKVTILPPRVDLKRFAETKTDWRITGRPIAVIVGSVTERKGQLRYLKAVLGSDLDVTTWIVGDGPDRLACETFVASMGAQDRVRFFGSVSHAELAAILPRADVLVLFSSMEGTPRAIMEGMAVGLPIVTTDAGFCADIVENGVEGIVLGAEPERELSAALARLFADEPLRASMGRAGRARVEREFDADKVFAGYRALISETAAT